MDSDILDLKKSLGKYRDWVIRVNNSMDVPSDASTIRALKDGITYKLGHLKARRKLSPNLIAEVENVLKASMADAGTIAKLYQVIKKVSEFKPEGFVQ